MAEGCCNGRQHFGHFMTLHNAMPENYVEPPVRHLQHIGKKMKAPPAELYEYIPQVFHTDFGEEAGAGWFRSGVGCAWNCDEVPCTAMLALSHAQLDFALGSWEPDATERFMQSYPDPDAVVTSVGLENGDIIIWRGDLLHRGPASNSECLRVLCHTYSADMHMVGNKLYNIFQT